MPDQICFASVEEMVGSRNLHLRRGAERSQHGGALPCILEHRRKVRLTEQIEKYVGHSVVVFGAAKPTPDGKNIVIQVETLQLK